jgi:hypothetical protein
MDPDKKANGPAGVGGWLLVLCGVLLLWQPLNLAVAASSAMNAIAIRGPVVGLVLAGRLLVTAFGVAAGIALLGRRDASVAMAKASLALSAATDVFVYATPYAPSNRMPGDTPLYIAGSLAFYGLWMVYLMRSTRVRNTFTS